MSYWYLIDADKKGMGRELLLDLDDATNRKIANVPRVEVFRRRLQDAMREGKLNVSRVWLARSNSEHKFHAVVLLAEPLPLVERLVWEFHLCSDLFRAKFNLLRAVRGDKQPSLLWRSEKIPEFYREPDAICNCTEKHREDTMRALGDHACPVWRKYRGLSPDEMFGSRLGLQERQRFVPLPIGSVPLNLIMDKGNGEKTAKQGKNSYGKR